MLPRRPITLWLAVVLLAAGWLPAAPSSERDQWQQPEKIMDAVGVRPGMVIGEAGAGEGYFTFKLAQRVGPDGHVYANDIVGSVLATIRRRAEAKGVSNITTILGVEDNPRFPPNLDMAVMVYVFHHLDHPPAFLANLRRSLKPGAPLVLVERDPAKFDYPPGHFLSRSKLVRRIEAAGFRVDRVETFLPRDNIYVCRPADASPGASE